MCPPRRWSGAGGGGRYVEGCWGFWEFRYLKIQKLPNVHLMFLIDMKIISNILKIVCGVLHHLTAHNFEISIVQTFKISKNKCLNFRKLDVYVKTQKHVCIFKVSKFQVPNFQTNRYTYLPTKSEFQILRYETISFKDVPIFSCIV